MFLAARMAATNAAARGEPNPVVMSQPGRVGSRRSTDLATALYYAGREGVMSVAITICARRPSVHCR